MSYKKNLEELEGYFEKKDRRSTIKYRRSVKKAEINGYGIPNYQTPIRYVKAGNINILKSI